MSNIAQAIQTLHDAGSALRNIENRPGPVKYSFIKLHSDISTGIRNLRALEQESGNSTLAQQHGAVSTAYQMGPMKIEYHNPPRLPTYWTVMIGTSILNNRNGWQQYMPDTRAVETQFHTAEAAFLAALQASVTPSLHQALPTQI